MRYQSETFTVGSRNTAEQARFASGYDRIFRRPPTALDLLRSLHTAVAALVLHGEEDGRVTIVAGEVDKVMSEMSRAREFLEQRESPG